MVPVIVVAKKHVYPLGEFRGLVCSSLVPALAFRRIGRL